MKVWRLQLASAGLGPGPKGAEDNNRGGEGRTAAIDSSHGLSRSCAAQQYCSITRGPSSPVIFLSPLELCCHDYRSIIMTFNTDRRCSLLGNAAGLIGCSRLGLRACISFRHRWATNVPFHGYMPKIINTNPLELHEQACTLEQNWR